MLSANTHGVVGGGDEAKEKVIAKGPFPILLHFFPLAQESMIKQSLQIVP